jgi:hypothetical protein
MKQMNLRVLLTLLAALLLVACGSHDGSHNGETAVDDEHTTHTEHNSHDHDDNDHDDGHADHDDHSHDHGGRIPNDGAVIRIMAPAGGETFARGEQVIVEIETENFPLGEDGNHWHVFVNGESWGMVLGANYSEVLRGLTPGEHEISVYLSVASHEELADGDAVTIVVTE